MIELQDVLVPGLRNDVHRCSSGVDELRLGLVPKLQVDVERCSVERCSALSLRLDDLANRFNDEFRARAQHCFAHSGSCQVCSSLPDQRGFCGGGCLELLSWEECAMNLKRRVEQLGNSLSGLGIGPF